MSGDAEQPSGPGAEPPPGEGGSLELAPGVRVPEGLVRLSYARSSGPGGQNVNKLATKAEVRVTVAELPISARVRERLERLAGRRMTEGGELIVVSESERSQARNRAACFEKLRELLVAALAEPKVRRKTRPTRGSVQRRLSAKKARGETKRRRGGGGGGVDE